MKLLEAEDLALELMGQHGLSDWKFDWHNRKRALGTCNQTKKTIFLSKTFVPELEISQVKNTILHEIAHAIVGVRQGHNHIWKRKAIEIGCTGDRCSKVKVNIKAKYSAECNCGASHVAHRRPKRDAWCICKGRAFIQSEKLVFVQNF
jgi:predicted SprT family Zn-dependent metalloprotease